MQTIPIYAGKYTQACIFFWLLYVLWVMHKRGKIPKAAFFLPKISIGRSSQQ